MPSNTILGPGPLADKTGAVAARLLTQYAVPGRLLDKSASDLFEPPPISSAFADPSRSYPTHTAPATWLSAAAYHDSGSTDPSVGRRIKESCDWFGLSSEWDRLESCRPAEPKVAAVEKWALPDKKMYPIETDEEVKRAIAYFDEYSGRFEAEDRRTFAGELVKAAASRPELFSPDNLWRLEAEAGLGMPAENWRIEVEVRTKKARDADLPELAEAIEKSAMGVDYGSGAFQSRGGALSPGQEFRGAGELAELWRQLDRRMGWSHSDPLQGLVGETPSTAKAKLASATRSATGNWYRNEDLDRVPDQACSDLCNFGPVVSRAAKMAALADPTSPFERLALTQGVRPIQSARPGRVDWSAEASHQA